MSRPVVNKLIHGGNLHLIRNEQERLVAEAAIRNGCTVTSQVPVGESLIDLMIKNPYRNDPGVLVEVTFSPEWNAYNDPRKMRQIDNMRESGLPFSLLCKENIRSIRRALER